MNSNRRKFLQTSGALAAQSILVGAGLASLTKPRIAAAAECGGTDWGALHTAVDGWTCETHEGYKILEIHLTGGASQWEAFWLPGNGAGPNYSDYDMGAPDSAPFAPGGVTTTLDLSTLTWGNRSGQFPCEAPDIPALSTDSALFAAQSGGGNIYWGAATKPIFRRPDIFNRARMVTQFHDLAPHEAARPFCMTGLRLGNPRLAGTGAAIQRRAMVNDSAQNLPVSYVLHRSGSLAANYAAATGAHPGSAKPLVIQLSSNDSFHDSLSRAGVSAESDDLLSALRYEYQDRMRYRGSGDPVRSSGFNSYWNAAQLLGDAPALQSLFSGGILQIDNNEVVSCPDIGGTFEPDTPAIKTMLEAAASLLEDGPARYVCCIDSGLGGSYDTHNNNHFLEVNTNIYNVMHHLANVIHHPVNNPTGTLNLDNTMVVITTEFGRTPWINGSAGRDHWVRGHCCYMFGGPIPEASPTIRGSINATTAITDAPHQYSFADFRGALLLAAGVDPFAPDNFRFSDFSPALQDGVATEQDLRLRMKDWILGV